MAPLNWSQGATSPIRGRRRGKGTFTQHSFNLHSTYAHHSLNIRSTFIQHLFNIHSTIIQHSLNMHSTFTQHSLNIHSTFTQHSINIHSTFTQHSFNIVALVFIWNSSNLAQGACKVILRMQSLYDERTLLGFWHKLVVHCDTSSRSYQKNNDICVWHKLVVHCDTSSRSYQKNNDICVWLVACGHGGVWNPKIDGMLKHTEC